MEVYNQIKRDIAVFVVLVAIMAGLFNQFNIGIDSTDKDGWHRSGVELIKDYGTGKEYLYKNGAIIERKR